MNAASRSPSSPAAPASSAATWSTCCSSAASRVRVDRQPGRRARARTSRTTPAIPTSRSSSATSASSQPGDALFAGARLRVPLRRHRRHRAVDRAADRVHVGQRAGHGARARSARAHAGVEKFVYAAPPPATAWPRRRRARTIRSRRSIPTRCQQVPGRAGGVPLAPGLPAAGELDPHLQRLRHALAHLGRLRRGVRRVPAQKLAGKPFTVVGDGTQTPRLPLRHRRRRGVPGGGRDRAARRDLEPRRRQSAVGQPPGRAARRRPVVHIPKRPGEPDCTWADITKITRELGWQPQVSASRRASARMLAEIDYWRDAPLWDPESIAKATETWFEHALRKEASHDGRRQQHDCQPQDQDRRRAAARPSARGRATRR